MPTIKDVAKKAGVSSTTVSIIINGKAQERRIAPETVERVREIMNEMGYRPNLSARRLRFSDLSTPTIAFYWPQDYRTNLLAQFLSSLSKAIEAINPQMEFTVCSYKNDEFEKYAEPLIKNSFSGAIIGASSAKDVEYLESLNLSIPIVLLNRESESYSTVITPIDQVGALAAQFFANKGYKEAAVLTGTQGYLASALRVQSFIEECKKRKIRIKKEHIYQTESTIAGGAKAARAYCGAKKRPAAVFTESDFIALGAVRVFNEAGLKFPEDIELLSVGLLDPEFTTYSTPAISTIYIDTENNVLQSLKILNDIISGTGRGPVHVQINPRIFLRETFTA